MRSTIICVDDEKMLLNILAEQLTQWFGTRYTVEKALSGEDALQILDECMANNEDVSLVISDYVMPGMRGDELLGLVSKRDPRIRKIMLTGYSSVEGIANAINNGGLYRYIAKPWDTKDLMLTIVEAIRSYETEKKNADLTKGFEAMYKKYESLYLESQGHLQDAYKALNLLACQREPARTPIFKQTTSYLLALVKQMQITDAPAKQFDQIAALHGVGCAGLTDAELAVLRQADNPEVSADTIRPIQQKVTAVNRMILSSLPLSETVTNAIYSQFERLDGSGPAGLRGSAVPRESFMLSLSAYFAGRKAELVQNNSYEKASAVRLLQVVINKQYPSEIVIPFVEIVKAEFAD